MKIKYFAWLKDITKIDMEDINNSEIIDIKSLKKYLSKQYLKLKNYLIKDDIIRFAINLEYTSKNHKITSNDEIALFPPVSGG